MKTAKAVLATIGLSWILLNQDPAAACGLDWGEPKSFFPDIDFQGHIHVIDLIGEVKTSKGSLPIYLIFNSSNKYTSPYTGSLDMPLLSSRIEQLDEQTFVFKTPSGWRLPFIRDKRNPTILNGSGGMKAVVDTKAERVTVWAECGDKIIFAKGRIIELQTKGVKLAYFYSDDRLSEIKEGGDRLLKVNTDSATGGVTGVSLGETKNILFSWGDRPVVQSTEAGNLISTLQKTVTRVVLPDQSERSFEFSVNDKIEPTLRVNNDRNFSWSAQSFLAKTSGSWTYDITPAKERFDYAHIRRHGPNGSESWFFNGTRGEEIVESVDGTHWKRNWFPGGLLMGSMRSITSQKQANGEQSEIRFHYDDHARLSRISESGRVVVLAEEPTPQK